MIERFATDLRHAFRGLRASPGFTIVAVLTLALGIGLNAAVFTVVNAVLLKPFPFIDRPERVLYVERPGLGLSGEDFEQWRARAASFTGMAAATAWLASISDGGGAAERCAVTLISPGAFELIGQQPLLGRGFTALDAAPGAAPVAILSHALWQRRYGGDPAVLGRTLRFEMSAGTAFPHAAVTVIGVMAPQFSFPLDQDLWIPRTVAAGAVRDITFFFARVADGVAVEMARAELEAIGAQLQRADAGASQRPYVVQSFNEHFNGPQATLALSSMMGAVGFLLLIACANVANLILARSMGRSREVSVRMALGAGRRRIVQQLLTESALLAALGGVAGWGVARLAVRAYQLSGYAPFNYVHYVDLAMDGRVFGVLVAASIGAGLLFGLAPALAASSLDISTGLKDASRAVAGGRRTRRVSALLVAGEVTLAVVLLAGAGVMIRSVVNIYAAPVGIDASHLLLGDVGLPAMRYPDAESRVAFHARLKERLQALPGVTSAAIADRYPTQGTRPVPYALDDDAVADGARSTVSTVVVGPDYFRTMGAALLAGREFTPADGGSAPAVVLVNRAFADLAWAGQEPLGKHVRLPAAGGAALRAVVGVVSNVVQNDRRDAAPLIYLPYGQQAGPFTYVFVQTRVPPDTLAVAVRREIAALDPMLPAAFQPLTERLERNYRDRGLYGALLAAFAVFGLTLASVGLYAVVAHLVRERTQEIGIRTAMGATARDIGAFVMAQGMRPVVMGLPAGVALSTAVNQLLQSQLVHVSSADPVTLAVAAAVLLAAAALGCAIPARRAMRVDPIVALRHE